MNSIIAGDGAPARMPLCSQRAAALAFDAHDARAHLVDLLLGVVCAVVLARDDVLALGLRPHRQRQHARRVGLIGHRLHQKLDRLAGGQLLFLEKPLQLFRDLLAIGFRHVDVGQHLLDRVAALEAQRELVAVARRRLGLGRRFRRLHLEALKLGKADRRRGFGVGQDDRRRGGAAGWRAAAAPEGRRSRDSSGASAPGRPGRARWRRWRTGQAGTAQKPGFWQFSTGPTERGNPS